MFKCRFHIIWICWKSSLSQRQLQHSASLVTRPICSSYCTELFSVLTGVRPVDLWLWMRLNPPGQLTPAAVVGHTGSVGESQMLSGQSVLRGFSHVHLQGCSCPAMDRAGRAHRTLGVKICLSLARHSPAKGQKEQLIAQGTLLGDCQSQGSPSMGDS